MSLLFVDSADHYGTAEVLEKYTSMNGVSVVAGIGRRGTSGLRGISSARYVAKGLVTGSATVTLGAAVNVSAFPTGLLAIGESGTTHLQVWALADGSLAVYLAGGSLFPSAPDLSTLLCQSAPGLVAVGTYGYVELQGAISNTVGTTAVRYNGTTVTSASGIDTQAGGTGVVSVVYFGGNADLDDLYVLDSTGSAPWTTFLGDCRVDLRLPTAPGATTGWTPSAGANWQCVDEVPPNDDTDYTTATTAGLTDTFVVEDAPVAGATIYGIQHCVSLVKTDSGACTVAPVIRHGSTDYPGAAFSPGLTYAYGLQIAATNPGTGAAWVESDFNAAQFGYVRVT